MTGEDRAVRNECQDRGRRSTSRRVTIARMIREAARLHSSVYSATNSGSDGSASLAASTMASPSRSLIRLPSSASGCLRTISARHRAASSRASSAPRCSRLHSPLSSAAARFVIEDFHMQGDADGQQLDQGELGIVLLTQDVMMFGQLSQGRSPKCRHHGVSKEVSSWILIGFSPATPTARCHRAREPSRRGEDDELRDGSATHNKSTLGK